MKHGNYQVFQCLLDHVINKKGLQVKAILISSKPQLFEAGICPSKVGSRIHGSQMMLPPFDPEDLAGIFTAVTGEHSAAFVPGTFRPASIALLRDVRDVLKALDVMATATKTALKAGSTQCSY